ncbi:Myb-like DNA-binding domain containing protein [Tritrichomonas foetus]|uniref:Myb-like DNA-binding domain containing protein n=1 Tax=Tritrichomonas foetus TaxID=1144522 RepID=A0A1J4J277_9EUKA|nr:Myb-like DNA-binding domain containing protein [Tritrichomonas foetus]|eukprot:OHS93482.1 Myb-like DNA-binding domain containing protein [Tritrichomonas foetus]
MYKLHKGSNNKNKQNKQRTKAMFTKKEDEILRKMVSEYGEHDWNFIASFVEGRNKRQCRERWCKFISPKVNVSAWSQEEEELLLQKYSELGPKWTTISKFFNNRSDINVKSRHSVIVRRNTKLQNSQSTSNSNSINSSTINSEDVTEFSTSYDSTTDSDSEDCCKGHEKSGQQCTENTPEIEEEWEELTEMLIEEPDFFENILNSSSDLKPNGVENSLWNLESPVFHHYNF